MKMMLENAKAAKTEIARLTSEQKNAALNAMADALIAEEAAILAANALDLEAARGTVSDVMLDRLQLTSARIAGMAQGIREVAALPDPTGMVLEEHTRSDGLLIQKKAVPMGVIAIIYESRPNVTSDAAALALKSGNVCVLRGGKEAFRSANAIVNALRAGLAKLGITQNAVNLVQDTTRASATALMTANGYIDLLIPRGGAGLINACVRTATVPCIATGTGICHVYVEKSADQAMALNIIENAKTSRPSVCNAEEVLLVDKAIAWEFLPKLHERIGGKVELRLDEMAASIIPGIPAGEQNFWSTSSPSSVWRMCTKPWPTLRPTPPATARPSSLPMPRRKPSSPPVWTAQRSMSMLPPGLPMAANLVWAVKWAFPPRSSMPGVPWVCGN